MEVEGLFFLVFLSSIASPHGVGGSAGGRYAAEAPAGGNPCRWSRVRGATQGGRSLLVQAPSSTRPHAARRTDFGYTRSTTQRTEGKMTTIRKLFDLMSHFDIMWCFIINAPLQAFIQSFISTLRNLVRNFIIGLIVEGYFRHTYLLVSSCM